MFFNKKIIFLKNYNKFQKYLHFSNRFYIQAYKQILKIKNSKYHIKATNKLILYIHFLSLFLALNAGILNNPGNKFNPNG